MKTVLFNPPYSTRVMRRYPCSYNVSNFLFPPLELMYLGRIIREWKKDKVILIDAIAERLNTTESIKRIDGFRPDLLVFIAGLEILDKDLEQINKIKKYFPELIIVCIGYLPSVFPQELLTHCDFIDYIIMGEPEISFSELYDALKEKKTYFDIDGVAGRTNGKIVIGRARKRITDLNILPFPDRSLIKLNLYSEFFLPKPFTTMLTSRGCPYGCIFCVNTYGKEIFFRSIDNVLKELEELTKYGIKCIRFMDDTFTFNEERVIDLCLGLIKNKINITWSCLGRADTLDSQMLKLMRKGGCRRIYLGIESGSQRILDYYKKGYSLKTIIEKVKLIKDIGLESVGFFLIGAPFEETRDFNNSKKLAKLLHLDYLALNKLTAYPGTLLFEQLRDKIDFSLFPYRCCFKDMHLEKRAIIWEKRFYQDFYLHPLFLIKGIKKLLLQPRQALLAAVALSRYLISSVDKLLSQLRQDLI